LPFVLFVGNHSSGKSSFINYILQRNVQTAGVAPTDDCFTVIAPGPTDQDRDGPALIGDPDMGFRNLRQFGPTLIHHTQLKIRAETRIQNFMLVDSPGMIDSPSGGQSSSGVANSNMDRGYDFQNVVKWFAERADVVLLFFDPDKPGTTGETLKILLHALGGNYYKMICIQSLDFWNVCYLFSIFRLLQIFASLSPSQTHTLSLSLSLSLLISNAKSC